MTQFVADHHARANDGVGLDAAARSNLDVWADGDAGANLRTRTDLRAGMDGRAVSHTRFERRRGIKKMTDLRKGETRSPTNRSNAPLCSYALSLLSVITTLAPLCAKTSANFLSLNTLTSPALALSRAATSRSNMSAEPGGGSVAPTCCAMLPSVCGPLRR